MAKPLIATPRMIEEAIAAATEEIKKKFANGTILSDGKIEYSQAYYYDKKDFDRPQLNFTPEAWAKMTALVATTSSEIAWNGVVEREDLSHFTVTDILMYPQEVASATVTVDEAEMAKWFREKVPREIANKLRFQGHSHVNMSPQPSSTDLNTRKIVVEPITGDEYYIFLIINKSWEMTAAIYDMATGKVYEDKDIDIGIILTDGTSVMNWATQQKKDNIKEKTVAATKFSSSMGFGDYYDGYDHKYDKSRYTGGGLEITVYTIMSETRALSYYDATKVLEQLNKEVKAKKLANKYKDLIDRAEELVEELYK